LFEFSHPGLELREELLTKDFQRNSQVHVDRIIESMDQTVAAAGLSYPDIDEVCFTGGTAKLPALRQELDARLGREKVQEHRHFHSVVGGLAEKAKSFR
jgi:hypothetical chaperone protein